MYGTVATMKVQPGREKDLLVLFDEWEAEVKPTIDGAVSSITYQLDDDPTTFIICAIFKDKAAYFANADNPVQDKWYRRMRELLTTDPEWRDGEIVRGG